MSLLFLREDQCFFDQKEVQLSYEPNFSFSLVGSEILYSLSITLVWVFIYLLIYF